jgi:hypothetical protein
MSHIGCETQEDTAGMEAEALDNSPGSSDEVYSRSKPALTDC